METLALLWTAAAIIVSGVSYWFLQWWAMLAGNSKTAAEDEETQIENLISDILEWIWGPSNHQSPSVPGRSPEEAARIHEERVADLLGARPGQRILDVGCGLGGPTRAIAAKSGAHVVGITIDEHQAGRARAHNEKAAVNGDVSCEVVCGSFLEMPFEEGWFDGAYSIESTYHAARLEEAYSEVFRVLKPGALYVSYEFVTTDLYDAGDPEHADIVSGIERLCGVPSDGRLRAHYEIAEIAKKVGFEVVVDRDLAKPPAGAWWTRIKTARLAYLRNRMVANVVSWTGMAPRGVVEQVYCSLTERAAYMCRGGETGIYSPMHMILCRKPLN